MEQEPNTPRERAEDLIRLLVPDWRPTPQQILWAIRIGVVLGLLVAIGYAYDVTPWDWLKLLIVPAVIAVGAAWFNRQQRERELKIADRRAQDEALQAYIDQIGQLLLDKDSPLRRSEEDSEVRMLARARTLMVLGRLNPSRKGSVLQFLYESDLITREHPILDFTGAALQGTALPWAKLRNADLRNADLGGADLHVADLEGADLETADLTRANLRGANLSLTNLRFADLRRTYLDGAVLRGAIGITQTRLCKEAASLEGATMPNGQKYEEWLKSRGEDGQTTAPEE